MDHRAPAPCPHCHRRNTLHADVQGGVPPEDGDISICWGCHLPAVFFTNPVGALKLRVPSDEEWRELLRSPQISAALSAADGARTPHEAVERYRRDVEQ